MGVVDSKVALAGRGWVKTKVGGLAEVEMIKQCDRKRV